MEHLALEIFDLTGTGSKYARLPENTSITITDTSEVFANGDVWSYTFSLNVNANAHIFGTSGDMHGSRLHEQLNHRRARLWVESIPLYLGYLKLDDEAEVDEEGNVDVGFESGQKTFEDMIEGAKANQVPMMSDVMFGVALWRKRWVKFGLKLKASIVFEGNGASNTREVYDSSGGQDMVFEADGETDAVQEYPSMVFPSGEFYNVDKAEDETFNCINTDYPYDDEHPYCNVAICYQKQGYEKKNDKGEVIPDYSAEPEAQRGYEVAPANRVNSAPNFFVIYWIRALMKHLGIHIEENQMTDVQDLRRLFFVNTKCAYKEVDKLKNPGKDIGMGRYKFKGWEDGHRLVPEQFVNPSGDGYEKIVKIPDSGFVATIKDVKCSISTELFPPIQRVSVDISEVNPQTQQEKYLYERANCWLHDAIATSDCFPDADISEVISALESGFGIRLLFSDDYKKVRIVLLRNIFRSKDVQKIDCDVVGESKVENSIRGFRMTYGDNDDTAFYYKGFADMLPHKKEMWKDDSDKHDYSQWDLNADYSDIIHRVSAFNKVCYVTPVNGNAYGIKVDKDAKRYDELHPSLFEYAGFMDAEDGDCTGEEETIETISVGFTPAIMNDLNWEEERNSNVREQRFALFVGEDMRPRRPSLQEEGVDYDAPTTEYDVDDVLYGEDSPAENMRADDGVVKPGEFSIASDMFAAKKDLKLYAQTGFMIGPGALLYADWEVAFDIDGHINEGYRLYLQDNYEPNDEGISPIEKHDWGITLGIMRGSGSDRSVLYGPDPDDNEGNDTWSIRPGSSVTTHPDTCDNYGNVWDYNGDQQGKGDLDGRISLKLRAEKPNPNFKADQEEGPNNRRYLEITTPELSRRGLADQFYKEYSFWVRNARIAKRKVPMTLAQLLAIDKTVRVTVGDITGFIRKMQFTVNNETGLSMVDMEIMYI